ncbi:hypothetical protein SprV_0702308600 [Sparganum proliferum]
MDSRPSSSERQHLNKPVLRLNLDDDFDDDGRFRFTERELSGDMRDVQATAVLLIENSPNRLVCATLKMLYFKGLQKHISSKLPEHNLPSWAIEAVARSDEFANNAVELHALQKCTSYKC